MGIFPFTERKSEKARSDEPGGRDWPFEDSAAAATAPETLQVKQMETSVKMLNFLFRPRSLSWKRQSGEADPWDRDDEQKTGIRLPSFLKLQRRNETVQVTASNASNKNDVDWDLEVKSRDAVEKQDGKNPQDQNSEQMNAETTENSVEQEEEEEDQYEWLNEEGPFEPSTAKLTVPKSVLKKNASFYTNQPQSKRGESLEEACSTSMKGEDPGDEDLNASQLSSTSSAKEATLPGIASDSVIPRYREQSTLLRVRMDLPLLTLNETKRRAVSWDTALPAEIPTFAQLPPVTTNPGFCLNPGVDISRPEIPLRDPITLLSLPASIRDNLVLFLPSQDDGWDFPLYRYSLVRAFVFRKFLDPHTFASRKPFMQLIDPDFPDLILCRDCKIMHPISHVVGSLQEGQLRSGRLQTGFDDDETSELCLSNIVIGKALMERHILPQMFTFAQLQLVMKRHRLGFETQMQLQNINSARVFQRENWVHLWTSKTKIVQDRLLVRTQHWFMLPPGTKRDPNEVLYKLLRWSTNTQAKDSCNILCKHQESLAPLIPKLLKMETCGFFKKSKKIIKIADSTGLLQCDYCAAEFSVDMDVYEGEETCIVFTAWRDLGRCINVFDERFQAHFEGSVTAGGNVWRDDWEGIGNYEGEIAGAFEGGSRKEEWVDELKWKGWLADLKCFTREELGERKLLAYGKGRSI